MHAFKNTAALLVAAVFTSAASAQVTVSTDTYTPNTPKVTAVTLPFAPAPVKPAPEYQFHLKRGVAIHEQITEWAEKSGWTLIWQPRTSWLAIGDASFAEIKDVTLAVSEVITILRDEGKPIRLNIAEGNRIMEVVGNEIRGMQ